MAKVTAAITTSGPQEPEGDAFTFVDGVRPAIERAVAAAEGKHLGE